MTQAMLKERAARAELDYVRNIIGSENELSKLFGLNRSSVHRWRRRRPDAQNELKLVALRWVLLHLSQIFRPEVIPHWLLGTNAFLGNHRPIDFIKQGRFSEVMAAVEQTSIGAYA